MCLHKGCLILAALAAFTLFAQAGEPPELKPLRFLIGQWEAVGSGKPGTATGSATFASGLQERVLIRTSYAEYPARGSKPAARHDDLMVIYVDSDAQVKADYYDNEGHIIRYHVQTSPDSTAAFVSEVSPTSPRYRLTYRMGTDGLLSGSFEIAQAVNPEAFTVYLSWTSRKGNVQK